MKKTILLSIVVLLILHGFTTAANRLVPDEYATIQDAVDAAVNGDVVIVDPDIYTGDGNRDIDFFGKAITVRSTDPNDPNIVATTIIDCQGTEFNQHRAFYFHTGEGPKSVLAGFTIKNGNARCGGGIYCIESSPTIVSCTFSDNMALQYEYVYSLSLPEYGTLRINNNSDIRIMCPPPPPQRRGNGAGICCVDSNATVLNCIFFNNSAYEHGGGMYSMGGNPTLISCLFSANFAGGGGGMANLQGSNSTLKNCTFIENTAETGGGGMRNADNSNPTLTDCTFRENTAGWSGGLGNYFSNPTLTNCTFIGNSADNNGGGINNYESNPVFINCIFSNNSAKIGGGIFSEYYSSSTLDNCTFSENTAHHGGGIYCVSCSPNITSCTFNNNTAEYEEFSTPPSPVRTAMLNVDSGVRIMCPPLPPSTTAQLRGIGGGIYCNNSVLTLTSSTFTENSSFEYGGAVYGESDSNSTFSNCIFKGNSAGSGGGIESHNSNLILTNCVFTENSAVYGGGGIRNEFCSSFLTNCIFKHNSAGWSGGVGNYYSISTIRNCIFRGNSAETNGGGMNNSESDIVQTNCIYSGNSAISGGGLFSKDNMISMLTNCTFAENIASYGGGIFNQNAPSPPPPGPPSPPPPYPPPLYENIINNCILWGNEATHGPQIYLASGSFALVSYSDVQGDWPGEGNINADPYFIELGYWVDVNDPNILVEPDDPAAIWVDGDYRLRVGSPCIDAGMDAGIYEDIDGNVRPFDFPGVDNNGDLPDFDIGAYENVLTIQGRLTIIPRTISYSGRGQKILAVMHLPEQLNKDEINVDEKLVLYPGQIFATTQRIVPTSTQEHKNIRLYAVFDKTKFINVITENGDVSVTVIGRSISGEYFYGTDTVKINSRRNGLRMGVYD
ncbi:MAG: right-handed parallel beta-helix repeat-containing protein [Planctomycetota bacterium]|jgi:predicted outer membrane repeat protein